MEPVPPNTGIAILQSLLAFTGGLKFYFVSKKSGRDAARLANVKRVKKISDLETLLKDDMTEGPLVVSVIGRVASDSSLKFLQTNMASVMLYSQVERNILKRMGLPSVIQNIKNSYLQSVHDWHIEDGTGRVYVREPQRASGFQLLLANEQFVAGSPSFVQDAVDRLAGIKSLGVIKSEYVLPIGRPITVIGQAVQSDGKTIITRSPGEPFYFTTDSVDQLILKLGKWSRVFAWVSTGCTLAGVAILALHTFQSFKRWRNSRRRADETAGIRRRRQDSMRDGLPNLCVVCFTRSYNAVFLPCGHICTCIDCGNAARHCPLCRGSVNRVVRAYLH